MPESPDTLRDKLETLRVNYAQQLPGKVQAVEQACRALLAGPWSAQAAAPVHRQAHTLAGFGVTFGFPALGRAARALEVYLQMLADVDGPPTEEQRTQVEESLAALRRALSEPAGELPLAPFRESAEGAAAADPNVPNRLVFIAEPDPGSAEGLARQIGHFGYRAEFFPGLGELLLGVGQTLPAAILTDIAMVQAQPAAGRALAELARREPALPVMFFASTGDLKTRLQAVRAAGSAFFTRPVDVGALIDTLDRLAAQRAAEPYRVLIVEDDPDLARYYAATLRQAGMVVETLTDPLAVMRALVDFRPDLILMDVYMAGCTGVELAALIRQQEAYLSIPIVFLSSETNPDKQFAALGLGGDDFLTKPIEPEHLIASILHRAHRSRILRSFMVRDSLTGLLNHIKTKEQLAVEVSRARRQRGQLAFAMIDLDHFKAVNDKYGHQMGDRVLKALARLLLQRLRKIDVIGRYGGEEFAVILPGTEAPGAVQVLDEIRESYAHLQQQAEGTEFTVTFSCGVATFPGHGDAAALIKAADKALYRAKYAGRNRVVLAAATQPV
jgi:diguanylate cyclase (GGDEF)-like protein